MILARPALTALVVTTLVACSQSPKDPCSLLRDANASIGQPVTASRNSQPGRSSACAWKSADGRLCGGVTVLGSGWNEVPDVAASYKQLTASMTAFGPLNDVADVGDEAQSVDTGSSGVMLVFRQGDKVAVTVSACNGHSLSNDEFTKKLGRELAAQL